MPPHSRQEEMSKEIKIVTWNANGICQHTNELEIFIRTNNIDICLISETHLSENQTVKVANFKCYHSPHPSETARGGSAILINKNIQHRPQP